MHFRSGGDDADKNVRTLWGGESKAYESVQGGGGGKKVTI